MPAISARAHIRKIVENDGMHLVSFPEFSAYFKIPAGNDAMVAKILQAQENGTEITFTYNADLVILTVA